MEYRMEIDALNALIREQERTNELLQKLIESKNEEKQVPVSHENKLKRGPRAK